MMACSYLSASGSGMKTASTSAACWTPPAMPGCSAPEMESPSQMLPTGQTFMRPPGLLRLMSPPSFVPTLPGLRPSSGLALTSPSLCPPPSGIMPTAPGHAPTPMSHMPATTGHMPSPAALIPPPGLMQEPALDLTTTASLKLPPKSSHSDDDTE